MRDLSIYQPNVTGKILIDSIVFEKQIELIKCFRSILLNEMIKIGISRYFQKIDKNQNYKEPSISK